MKKKIATVISYLLHPMLMPTFGVLFIFLNGSYISLMPDEVKKIILLVIFANTIGLPALIIPFFVHFGVIKSLMMDHHKERILPLAFILIPYLFSVYFMFKIPVPDSIGNLMLGATILVILALLVSLKWKISLHMLGAGGFIGLLVAFSMRFFVDVLLILSIAIFLTSLLASARLSLDSHKPSQIYSGFIVGFIVVFLAIYL